VASEIRSENLDDSNLSQSSHMNPLFVRARAAVKNASFGDNEGEAQVISRLFKFFFFFFSTKDKQKVDKQLIRL